MDLLENKIQPYAWGSRTAIAELLGTPAPSHTPQAEIWMGAHPLAPSQVSRGGTTSSLVEVVGARPDLTLGPAAAARFGGKLPFLLKVLAAAEPLSLQAHPSIADAERGFDEEEARGVPRDAPHRNYKDRNHKPELLCALTPFVALCGFRALHRTRELLAALHVRELSFVDQLLGNPRPGEALRSVFGELLGLQGPRKEQVVGATVAACTLHRGPFELECRWAVRIAALYPGDPGVVSALLLNLLELKPGEAIFLPAGNLHAYLDGLGVEIMASSDNVLRGGLTKKDVDRQELSRVLDFSDGPIVPMKPVRHANEWIYETPAPEFRLSRIDPTALPLDLIRTGPEILLCTAGHSDLRTTKNALRLGQGQSAFVAADEGTIQVSGRGALYRATVGKL